ncbi:MAG: flagellin [Rhodospirillaceae bacterium]|nr:flagellin [Rhodospirillaceae bacterium]
MSVTIRDLSANNSIIGYMLRTQSDMYKTQIQVSTGKISQDYIGISKDSNYLITSETTRAVLEQFEKDNSLHQIRLTSSDEVIKIIDKTLNEFRSTLNDFSQTDGQDVLRIEELQQEAFKTLQVMEGFMNTEADGRYVFSGGKVQTEPVNFGLTSLADFQAKYDGIGVTVPTTRDANLTNLKLTQSITGAASWLTFDDDDLTGVGPNAVGRITSVGADFNNFSVGSTFTVSGANTPANNGTYTVVGVDPGGTWIQVKTEMLTTEALVGAGATVGVSLTVSENGKPNTVFSGGAVDFTDINFNRATGQITVDAASQPNLAAIPVGSTITVAGTANNNTTYTVKTNTAGVLTVVEKKLTDDLVANVGTLEAVSYYKGDELTYNHRASKSRSLEQNINAIDPAFEKAFRAMFIIIQGVTGTEGGLDKNVGRAKDALYLIDHALGKTPPSAPPYGVEKSSSLEYIQRTLIFQRLVLERTSENNQIMINYLSQSEEKIENVDQTEAISRLLNYTNSMEASYQAFAKVRQLSLSNFL